MTQSAAFTIQQPRMKATVKAYMRLSFSTHRATIEQFGCVWIQNLAPNKEIGNLVGNKEIQKVCALMRVMHLRSGFDGKKTWKDRNGNPFV